MTDADSDELTELQYMIVGGNEGGRFAINTTTGALTTVTEIDREEQNTYRLIIEVSHYMHVGSHISSLALPYLALYE